MQRAVRGWLEATACVFAIGALSLVYAIAFARGAHPVAFILYAMFSAAAMMLATVGFGRQAAPLARHPLSWAVGLSIILLEVFYFQTIAFVAPAHGNVVLRIAVPISMAAGWVFLDRRPPPLAIAGGVATVLVVAFVVAVTPAGVRWPMAIAGVLAGTFMVLRGFASEFHPMNRAARTVNEKLRFTGIVVLIASLLSFALVALAAVAIPQTPMLPTAAQMLHLPTMLLGCAVGGAVLTLMFYLNFSSVVAIGTENLMAMMAFSPATTWIFQEIGVALGWIHVQRPDVNIVAAIVACIAAVLLIFFADARARVAPVSNVN
jgi:hypothetical protein